MEDPSTNNAVYAIVLKTESFSSTSVYIYEMDENLNNIKIYTSS